LSKLNYTLQTQKNKKMKTIYTIALSLFSTLGYSQVIIGDAIGTVPSGQKTSVLLEFAAGQNKGIILPYTTTLPSGAGLVPGTIILDATNATKARVKMYNGTSWIDLSSGHDGDVTGALTLQPTTTPSPSAKVIIGANSTSADGILVLESTNKAMVLPMVVDVNNILEPSAGMMVYVNKPGLKRLAVFNGSVWTFWKP
jgi:hypothetical protein